DIMRDKQRHGKTLLGCDGKRFSGNAGDVVLSYGQRNRTNIASYSGLIHIPGARTRGWLVAYNKDHRRPGSDGFGQWSDRIGIARPKGRGGHRYFSTDTVIGVSRCNDPGFMSQAGRANFALACQSIGEVGV